MQIAAGQSAWVTTLKTQALAKIAAGQGQLRFLTSASDNGKAFTGDMVLTNLDIAEVTQSAIDEAAGNQNAADAGNPVFTHLNFGGAFTQS